MEGMPPYEGPDPAVSEALRTMQDDRNHPESVAAMVETPGRTALFEGAAARSVDLDSIFAGAGEVADEDDDPDHARAGWYADPSGEPATLRYWNGSDWTEHVHTIPGGNDLCDAGARAHRERARADRRRRASSRPVARRPTPRSGVLAEGDRRNVLDVYRYWSVEAIVADLDTRRHPFHVAIENWEHDRNIGTVVRTATRFWPPRCTSSGNGSGTGAADDDRRLPARPPPRLDRVVTRLAAAHDDGPLPVIGVDNLPGSVPIESTELPQRCLLLFGQEGPGLSAAAHAAAEQVCSIAQFGSTRSINAGVAAGIAMHAWVRRWADCALPRRDAAGYSTMAMSSSSDGISTPGR